MASLAHLSLIGLVLAACGTADRRRPPVRPAEFVISERRLPPIAFRPAAVATSYNEHDAQQGAGSNGPLHAAVRERLAARTSLASDPRLDLVANELATIVRRGEPISSELLGFALHAHGIVEPVAISLASQQTSLRDVVAELGPQLDAAQLPTDGMLGVGGEGATVVIITRVLPLTLAPFARSTAHDGSFDITGTIDPRLHDLRAHLTSGDGNVQSLAVTRADDGGFHIRLRCNSRDEEQWLAIEAEPTGSLVLLPIACGISVPTEYWIEPKSNLDGHDAEYWLTAVINRERSRAGLRPLAFDRRATRAAREQAESMRQAKSVQPAVAGRDPTDRLRAAGLVAQKVSLAAMSFQELLRAAEVLMNDPHYRSQLLEPELDRVAVGTSLDADGSYYVAILFLRTVPAIDPTRFTQAVISSLRAHPKASSGLVVDKPLSRLAQTFAVANSSGWTHETLRQTYEAIIESELSELEWRTTSLDDPSKLDARKLVSDLPFDLVAVGVAQSSDAGPLAGRIWVVVFSGCKRDFRRSKKRTCVRGQP